MDPLSKQAGRVLDALTRGLEIGGSRKVDRAPGFMAVHVDRLTGATFSVAHYYEQNGDLCADPDMVFYKGPFGWMPVSFQQAIPPRYQEAVVLVDDKPTGFRRHVYRELRTFATLWMRNIREQQRIGNGRSVIRAEREHASS